MSGRPEPRSRVSTRSVTRLALGAWTFALPTDRVARVEEIPADAIRDDAHLDVARLFGLPDHASRTLRKLALEGHAPYALVGDLSISVVETTTERCVALPDYVRDWGERFGVEALVLDDHAFVFLLDVGRLIERHVSTLSLSTNPPGA